MQELIAKAEVLVEALPYIRSFYGKTVVVKYGGSAIGGASIDSIIVDIVLMKYVGMNPVVVHGGGPAISETLGRLGIETKFVHGLRVTDRETMDVVEMVLAGRVNKDLVARLTAAGGKAVGISGKDGPTITARRKTLSHADGEHGTDVGFVGEVESVDPSLLALLRSAEFIPVVAPLGLGEDGAAYNVNADEAAGHIAGALSAEKLVLLTDVPGVLKNGPDGELIGQITANDTRKLIEDGVISGGMIPKVEACLTALSGGVSKTHIIDGRIAHALLLEIFTDKGIGTAIRP